MTLAPVRTAALAAAVLLALPAAAQSVVVRGTVSDADGPVRLARVVVQADDADGDTLGVDVTDAAGAFAVAVVGTPGEPAPPAAGYAVGRAFPNPAASGHVVVRYTTPGDRPERAEADVFDLLGRRATPGAPLPAGAYVVRLRFADGSVSETRKFVVARGGVRVAAEQAQGALDARAGAPAARLLVAAPVVFVTVERAGYVTETRAVDAGGGVALDVVLSPAPAPTATIAPLASVQAGTALTLDGTGSAGAGGEDLAYSWDFGDGQRGGAARVAHVYTAPGTYTVTLTVRGAFGATAQTTATVEVTDPPAAAGAAPVRLVVTGTTGGAVVGATVSVVGGAATATTDGEGVAVVGGVPTGVPVVLAVEAEGFATQRLALDLPAAAEQETTVEVTLAARQPARTLRRAEEGGAVVGVEGVRVELPVEGLVHADGTPAVGDVEVRLTPVDVSDPDEIGAFPGDFAGVTPDGRAPLILSYGVAEYVFEQAGEPLDLMPGKTATIEIPLYVAQDADGDDLAPGDPYPLWSLDETTGEWVLEGEGTVVASAASPTGLALRADVSHFSWWNCDIAPDPYTTVPECGVGAENGLPTLQLDETCYIDGYIANTAGPRTRPNTTIGPNNDRGLPVPPGIDVVLEASARGGTLRGEATVNGEAGRTGAVVIVLRPVGVSAGGTIAPDTTLVGAIDPVGEEDTFTFATTAGRYVRVAVGRGQGSLLQGTVTVARPDGQAVQTEPFGALVGRVAFVAPTTGVYTITVDGTRSEPGTYTLDLIERSARQIAPGVTVTDAIDPAGDEDVFSFTATAGAYTRVAVGRGGGSFLTGTLTVVGPDGLALEPASFDSRTGQVSFTPETTGTYAAVVDGTGNGTGAYTLRLAEAVPQPLDVGTEATESVGPLGDIFAYRFTGTAGQPVDLYLGGEGVSTGRAEVLGPDGEPVAGFAASVNTSAFVRLPADGAYTVVVEVPNGPGTVVTSLRAVPTIAVGDEVTGALRAGERWSYLFSAAAGTLVRPAFADVSVEGTAGGASVFPLDGAQRDRRAFGVERLGGGTYRLQVLGGTRPSPSFTAAVAAIAAPAPLALDAQGRAVVTDAVETVGEVLLYRVETPVGSGLLARLAADGAGLAGATATVGVAPLQAGETVPREFTEVDGYGPSADRYEAQSDDGPAGLLETLGARLPDGVAYVVAVGAVRQFNSADAGDAPTGGFTLRTDVVAPAAAIEVDDDLAQCAGAATRSLHAAMFAATTGTTVTACAGRYAEAVSVPVLGGPTLAGTDRDAVVLAHEVAANSSIVINGQRSGDDDGLVLRDLTVEPTGLASWLQGDDLVVERVTVRPAAGVAANTIRGFQTGGADARFESVRAESAQTGVVVTGFSSDGTRVLNSQFSGAGAAMLSGDGSQWTVQGNTFELSGGGAVRLAGGPYGGHTVTGNTVTVSGAGPGTGNVIRVADGVAGGQSVVRDNVIETVIDRRASSEAALFFSAQNGGRVLAERNEVRGTSAAGVIGLSVQAESGGEVVVRNNVLDGLASFGRFASQGTIDLFSTADARVAFVNNSVRTAPGADASADGALVTARGASGALPITVVNNVLQGAGGVGVSTAAGATVTADHNLFFGLGAAYGGGASGGPGDVVGQDPLFVGGRLDVAAGSPAVDAGASAAAFPDVPAEDVDGTARPQGAAVDIGAHEQ